MRNHILSIRAIVVPVAVFLLAFAACILPREEAEEKESFAPADEWFERQRAFPFDEIPNSDYLRAQEYVKNRISVGELTAGTDWVLAGPTNIEGRITSIAIDPTDYNTVYAGSANGGVWKSTDFCQSWASIFDNQNTSSIGALAIDPIFANVVYCGTGEANSLRSYYPGTGMYKSTDGGNTWASIGLVNSFSIGSIAINPLNSQELYVAAVGSLRRKTPERGIYKSTDGGASWTQSLFIADSIGAIDVVIDPNNPNRVFAAMWERQRREDYIKYGGTGSALYLSTNAGVSWDVVNGGFPSNQPTLGRISIDIARSDPQFIYALLANTDGTSRGLYKSTDGGVTWFVANAGVAGSLNYAWFNRICKVNPANANHFFCGGLNMFLSTNGGANFTQIGPMHVDQHAVAYAQTNPGFIVIGNDGGIDYSTNGGLTWNANNKLPITQFYAGEIDYNNPAVIMGGAQDNSTLRTSSGSIDDWTDLFGGDGFYCLVDYSNSQNVYASGQNGGLGRSTNGGASFSSAISGLDRTFTNWMTPYVMDKNNPQTLYCGTYRIHRTTNGMQSWTPISPDLANGHRELLGTITTVDVSRFNPNVIYCGTDDANVWVTTSGGSSWQKINTSLPRRWVTRVTVHPDSANVCYVALSGYKVDSTGSHIYRTTNYGSTWTSINGNLPEVPINDVVIDPLDTRTLYIATDVGVMYTTDLGSVWSVLGAGFPTSVPCHDLTLHNPTRTLVVWTHGRSAFKITLPPPTSVSTTNDIPTLFKLFQNYPNPFSAGGGSAFGGNPATNIRFHLTAGAVVQAGISDFARPNGKGGREFVSLKVHDALGREVATLVDEELAAGMHEVTFDASGLASGVYVYRLEVGGKAQTRKMLLLK